VELAVELLPADKPEDAGEGRRVVVGQRRRSACGEWDIDIDAKADDEGEPHEEGTDHEVARLATVSPDKRPVEDEGGEEQVERVGIGHGRRRPDCANEAEG